MRNRQDNLSFASFCTKLPLTTSLFLPGRPGLPFSRTRGCSEVSVLYAYDIERMEPACAEVFPGSSIDAVHTPQPSVTTTSKTGSSFRIKASHPVKSKKNRKLWDYRHLFQNLNQRIAAAHRNQRNRWEINPSVPGDVQKKMLTRLPEIYSPAD